MPQIYGGAFLEQLDMACAVLVERLFINNPSSADHAVTYKIPEITFTAEANLGDLVTIETSINSFGPNSIIIDIKAIIENKNNLVACTGKAVFLSKRTVGLTSEFYSHGFKAPIL